MWPFVGLVVGIFFCLRMVINPFAQTLKRHWVLVCNICRNAFGFDALYATSFLSKPYLLLAKILGRDPIDRLWLVLPALVKVVVALHKFCVKQVHCVITHQACH